MLLGLSLHTVETHRVRIHESSGQAPEGFDQAEPTLEDAYFVLMRSGSGAAGAAA